ncbi:MAG: queuosine precursor transporter [Ardenticatenaceae bacterium]|nr:queuosine precursor transporter [Anaerolineales bacterium]MCB8968971.1 queuosine precursor transporter [Ardenticatenaceae bacterium]MCB8989278.1 queuosine precursor transporter [Ardenticatenaceae bacterium]
MTALTSQQDVRQATEERKARQVAIHIPRVAVVVVAAYIGAQMLADITSLKIGVVASLAVDMGTFIYPITFTLRDLVHKLLGKKNAQTLVITAGVINLFMAAYLAWAAGVPGDPTWGLDNEFNAILGPLWRIVIASILAEVVSELLDTEVYHWFVTKITRRYQWARVLISNAISVPIDNLIFSVGAFGALPFLQDHFLTLPWNVVWQIFIFNLAVKFVVTLVSLPFIYISPDRDWSQD